MEKRVGAYDQIGVALKEWACRRWVGEWYLPEIFSIRFVRGISRSYATAGYGKRPVEIILKDQNIPAAGVAADGMLSCQEIPPVL